MTEGAVPMDYAYCGTTNFIPSRKILRIAELVEQVKKGSREPVVRKRAFELARDVYNAPLNIKEMNVDTRLAIAETIFVWVRDTIAYINDPAGDFFQPAVKTIAVGAGDCDDQSILLAAMLGSIGFDPILVILPDHVYIELQAGEKQVPMDPTASNTAFGTLSAGMKAHFNEKYGLKYDEYLRIPIAHHVTVTATKQVVKTKTPLQMAMYLEEKAAASYNKGEYHTAEQRFVKAAKMYHDAGLHADTKDAREGLLASSKFCLGWAHLMQVLHLVLNKKQDELYLLQSEIDQAKSCFGICKPHFVMHGATGIAQEVDAFESVLEGYQETLLADFMVHVGDRDASARHYAKARASYKEAMTKTELSGLKSHVAQSLDSLSYYEVASQKSGQRVEAATAKITDDENLSEQFDIAPEELRMIQERLVNATGERLRNELVTLSVETGIPRSILEAIHGRAVEIVLRVEHPHPRDRYGNAVRVHPEIMAQLGLQRIDRARVVVGEKEHIVTVQPLEDNDEGGVIKVNKIVRAILDVNVGDTVKLERVSGGGLF
jgi:tetratricopeptide (TPR) repeat protein